MHLLGRHLLLLLALILLLQSVTSYSLIPRKDGDDDDDDDDNGNKDSNGDGDDDNDEVKKFKYPAQTVVYKTEPDFRANILSVTEWPSDPSRLHPGYIFIAPHSYERDWGPQIFHMNGELVWYGLTSVHTVRGKRAASQDFMACDFDGGIGNHLCFSEVRQGEIRLGRKSGGVNRFLNNSYIPVTKDVSAIGDFPRPNPHEFNALPSGKSMLQVVYKLKQADLTPYKGAEKGFILDGCLQEVELTNRTEVFRWCYLEHYPIWHTYLYLNIPNNTVNISTYVGGKGTKNNPWDPVHLNSVDKNEDNDYLISVRHMDQVLKIAGPDSASGKKAGTVLWKLGGKFGNFEFKSFTPFSRQHHARYISTSKTQTVISLFDNAWDGFHQTQPVHVSSSQVIKLDTVKMTARRIRHVPHPDGWLSNAQGSTHLFPNGNIFSGWGAVPDITEVDANGHLLYRATILPRRGLANYRTYKAPWIGLPLTDPKLVAYCQTCNPFQVNTAEANSNTPTPIMAYVSWNGDTQTRFWRYKVSLISAVGPWFAAGTFAREGFETTSELSVSGFMKRFITFVPYVSVEALDENYRVLSKTVVPTFVPSEEIAYECDSRSCGPPRFGYSEEYSAAAFCGMSNGPGYVILLMLVVVIEIVVLRLRTWAEAASRYTLRIVPASSALGYRRHKPRFSSKS